MDSAACEAKLVAIKVANSAGKGHAMRGWVSFLEQDGLQPTPAKGGGGGGSGGGGGGPNPLVDADMQKELPPSILKLH